MAVVGAGVSGIAAANYLQDAGEVTLFEKDGRIGGHVNSIATLDEEGDKVNVDTGFIVFNESNYPSFEKFLQMLKVQYKETDMSFSYTNEDSNVLYSGTLSGLVPSITQSFRWSHWKMLYGILKYSRILEKHGRCKELSRIDIESYLLGIGCPETVVRHYFLPLASAIWSCDTTQVKTMEAGAFIRFFSNHGLLQLRNRPTWFTIEGGSDTYLNSFSKFFIGRVVTDCKVVKVRECKREVELYLSDGSVLSYDAVVLATHADTSMRIIEGLDSERRGILEKHPYVESEVILHTDDGLLPANRRLWASWNVACHRSDEKIDRFQTSYYMNRLQMLSSKTNYFVSLNPLKYPRDSSIIYKTKYRHPRPGQYLTTNMMDAMNLNRISRIYFCGSYLGYGFHEDGFVSGKRVANILRCADR